MIFLTKGKKVELKKKKKKKIQKSKKEAEEVNSSPADDGKLNEKVQRKRKAKGGNVDLSEQPQTTPEGD